MDGKYPTEITGVEVSNQEDVQEFAAHSPFVWLGDALTMLALSSAGGQVPEALRQRAKVIAWAADLVVGNVVEDTPLGAQQFAAAAVAQTIVDNLRDTGRIAIE